MIQRFELRFESTAHLLREIESNLRRGRTFVPGQLAPADRSPCIVVVRHPETAVEVELSGEVVFAQPDGPHAGVGVDLVDADLQERLGALLVAPAVAFAAAPLELGDTESELEVDADGAVDGAVELLLEPVDDSAGAVEEPEDDAASNRPLRPSQEPDSRRGITVHERVRKLNPAARDRLARTGQLAERVALERAFGASVWDALLENGQISGAEIAKIAKNGLAPATVLSSIASHAGWLAKPEVRRALLSNPRLPSAQAERVLRSLPAAELRLVPAQAAYPPGVRAQARRLLQK